MIYPTQNEQRDINYLHQWECCGLMLLFFQIIDQTFKDKCECVTKWKLLLLNRTKHLCNSIYFYAITSICIQSYFYHYVVYNHMPLIKLLFISQLLLTGLIIEKCLWKAVRINVF